MEASIVERWAADGSLPTFASLAGRARAFTLDGRIDQFARRRLARDRHGAPRRLNRVVQRSESALQRRIAATRVVAVQNFPAGAIRLNVKGREPFGQVEAGEAYDAACSDLSPSFSGSKTPARGKARRFGAPRRRALRRSPTPVRTGHTRLLPAGSRADRECLLTPRRQGLRRPFAPLPCPGRAITLATGDSG